MKRRRSGTKGVRCINGKYFLLAGRTNTRQQADLEARILRKRGNLVRVIKLWECDYMIYEFSDEEKP